MTAGSVLAPMVIPMRAPQSGKPKTSVDSNTKIALCSTDNKEVDIYYTINGTKPEPFQPKKTPGYCTLTYTKPFPLPRGKVTIKALAVSKDGIRESNMVAKTFDVEYIPTDEPVSSSDDGLAFQEEIAQEKAKLQQKRTIKNLHLSSRSAWTDMSTQKGSSQLMSELTISDGRKPPKNARFLEQRFKNKDENFKSLQNFMRSYQPETIADQLSALEWKGIPEPRKAPDNSTQAFLLQRQTDFLKCVYCYADRPADPHSKFCNVCGKEVPPLPQNRLPPPEPGQMGLCIYCNSLVPFNTNSCVICEGPIPVQNQPQASIKLTDRLVCSLCGTANPCNLSSCVICDSKLSNTTDLQKFPNGHGVSTAPASTENKFIKCSKCLRINNSDARFCDWCGTKPNQSSCIQCPRCKAANHLMSTYCSSCAALIEPPHRHMDTNYSDKRFPTSDGQCLLSSQYISPSRAKQSTGTQTVGLFYPSQRQLTKKEEEEEKKKAYDKAMRDRQPLLTAVSPGRGYWRKQVEHICQHLKVHAQNCAEFRALIGEPKMGKLVSGTVHEDSYELSLTLNFALYQPKANLTNGHTSALSGEGFQSPYRDSNFLDSFRSESSQISEATSDTMSIKSEKKPKKAKRPKSAFKKHDISTIDRKLLKLIGANKEGEVSDVQQVLDEGADPNCTNKDGISALCVAVCNKHKDCIPIIIQAGADIHRKGPASSKGNTALHEAVALGPSGLDVLDTLLRCGAEVNKKNDRGETVYDMAIKSGYETVATRLAASLGQAHLDKMLRSKPIPLD